MLIFVIIIIYIDTMLRKSLFILFLVFSVNIVNAQSGYYYGNTFISLLPDSSKGVCVHKSRKMMNERRLRQGYKVVSLNEYKKIHVKSQDSTYVSPLFTSADGCKVIVLPKVIVKLKDNLNVEGLLPKTLKLEVKRIQRANIYELYLKEAKSSDEVFEIVNYLQSIDGVEWCEPDIQGGISAENIMYGSQYYLRNFDSSSVGINVESAWKCVNVNKDIVVGVVDCGVELTHEDLKDNVIPGYTINNSQGYGAPQNWNSYSNKAHGTACAGIIGAVDNKIGIKGVASGVKILPVNIAPYEGTKNNRYGFASSSEIANAIRWAYPKADILSCSWGGRTPSNNLTDAIHEATRKGRNGKGTVVIASSGNKNSAVLYPANLEDVIAVGSVNRFGERSSFSNFGNELDLVAPGEEIFTTDLSGALGEKPDNYDKDFTGTSASCPQVAGVVALMLSVDPNLKATSVKSLLRESARDLGELGFDKYYGAGLVDAGYAVALALRENMSITGQKIVIDTAKYTVTNLPDNVEVNWACSVNSKYSDNCPRLVNALNSRTVTAINDSKQVFSVKLKAQVCLDKDIRPINLRRFISGDGELFGFYHEVTIDGVQSLEVGLLDDSCEDFNEASVGNTVIINSDNFRNREVRYKTRRGSGYCRVEGDHITFDMPELDEGDTMDFEVYGGGVSRILKFKFGNRTNNTSFNPINVQYIEANKIKIFISHNTPKLDRGKLLLPNNKEWNLLVRNSITGEIMLNEKEATDEHVIDTSSYKKGIYIIHVNNSMHTHSSKILIK